MTDERTTRILFNKKSFFQDLGYEPHPGQAEIHASSAPRRVLACGCRWGKSLCAAMEALAAAMAPCNRSIGWVVAPTYDLSEKVFREIVVITAERLRHRIIMLRDSEKRLVIRNMTGGPSEIRSKSADNPISLLGEGLDWLVVDEAARLKPVIWEGYLTQRLIDRRGWALLISTPRGKGWFYELFRRGQGHDPDYASWNSPSWENPHIDRAIIEVERERLPERVFRQEFGAEFIEGSGSVFRKVRECATGGWQEPVPEETYFAGLDLAKIADLTVLIILNARKEAVFVDRFNKLDWQFQVNRIKAATDRYNEAVILCDTTGAGEPVYESLCAAGCRVEPYPMTQRSKNDIINNLAMMLEQGEIVLPQPGLWPEGLEELEAFEYSVTEAGNVRTSAPSGQHDDCVIALALASWQAKNFHPSEAGVDGIVSSRPAPIQVRSGGWLGVIAKLGQERRRAEEKAAWRDPRRD